MSRDEAEKQKSRLFSGIFMVSGGEIVRFFIVSNSRKSHYQTLSENYFSLLISCN